MMSQIETAFWQIKTHIFFKTAFVHYDLFYQNTLQASKRKKNQFVLFNVIIDNSYDNKQITIAIYVVLQYKATCIANPNLSRRIDRIID